MVLYRCQRCLKEFDKKYDYNKHYHRKFKCFDTASATQNTQNLVHNTQKNVQNLAEKNEFKCTHCGKKFARNFCLQRHLNGSCKSLKAQKDNEINILQNKVNNLACTFKETTQRMEKEIKQLRFENNKLIALNNAKQPTINGDHNIIDSHSI